MTIAVAIIGAGIGGLTAAIACRARGFDVTVYEQAERIELLGAGIQLSANATRVLSALDLLEPIRRAAFAPVAVQMRHAATGRVIARVPLGDAAAARHGAPYWQAHRGDLLQALLDAARSRGVTVACGKRCDAVTESDSTVEASFADGTRETADVLIGADGIHSRVRSSLFGDAAVRYTGYAAWRGVVPSSRLPAGLIEPVASVWLAAHRHFVHYFVRSGELVNFVGVVEAPEAPAESWRSIGDVRDLAADFSRWHTVVRTLVGAVDECFKWALYDREPIERWSTARATLLGDACHPMLPFMAQGAAMAIEDAWVLAAALARNASAPAIAFADYEYRRLPRTRRVVLASRAQGEMFHLHSRSAIVRRNLRLGIGSRFPGLAMKQLDWLHGHDVTAPL